MTESRSLGRNSLSKENIFLRLLQYIIDNSNNNSNFEVIK